MRSKMNALALAGPMWIFLLGALIVSAVTIAICST